MNALYPLFKIITEIENPIQIDDGITISKNIIETKKLYPMNLSKEDIHFINQAKLCLVVDKKLWEPEQASLIFILSCRLLKPTKIFIRYRVDDTKNIVLKIRDDYPYVPTEHATEKIEAEEFKVISTIFKRLNQFIIINSKTSNAAYFIGLAYRSRKWLEALIFHVCSLETLASSADIEHGITEKFVNRLHYFIGYDKDALRKLYNIRSELVHGRYLANSEDENLRHFIISEEVSRSSLLKILLNNEILNAFSKEDTRMNLFENG